MIAKIGTSFQMVKKREVFNEVKKETESRILIMKEKKTTNVYFLIYEAASSLQKKHRNKDEMGKKMLKTRSKFYKRLG